MTLEHEEVREKLVETALALMDEGGLEAVKARSVAQRVGVSVGTVYNLYGNVDGLLQAACARIYGDLNRHGMEAVSNFAPAMQAAFDSGRFADTPKGRLCFALLGLARVYMDFVTANGNRWAALLAFNRSRPVGEAEDWYLREQDQLIEIVVDLLKRALPGKSADELRTLAWTLWSSVHGIVSMSYVGQARPDAREWTWRQVELLVGLVVDGLLSGE